MKKKIIMIGLFILVIILTILILDSTNKIDLTSFTNKVSGGKVVKNTNKDVIKDSKIKGLDITNVSLTYVKGTGSTFSLSLKNNTSSVINIESFNITLKDQDGNVIAVLAAYVGGNVDPKQVNSIKVTAKEDISKATSVEYSEN